MVDQAADPTVEAALEEPAGKTGGPPMIKLVVILVLGVVLALGAFVLTRFVLIPAYTKYKVGKLTEDVVEEEEAIQEQREMGMIYLLSDFTVNLANSNGRRFLVAEFAIEASDEEVINEIQLREPQIRNEFITYLRSQSATEAMAMEFQETSKRDLIEIINSRLAAGKIDSLYYTRLILQ